LELHGKPHPEGYLLAAKRLGTEPRNCIVFEDAQVGIKAGVGSGAVVIGIRSLLTDAELKNAGAQYTVSDMTKVSVFVKDDDSLDVTVDKN
ncbi:DL-glycerol-3-phosphatase, partial [Coemansia sp. RSA 2399]